jgi:hypothetical protein
MNNEKCVCGCPIVCDTCPHQGDNDKIMTYEAWLTYWECEYDHWANPRKQHNTIITVDTIQLPLPVVTPVVYLPVQAKQINFVRQVHIKQYIALRKSI